VQEILGPDGHWSKRYRKKGGRERGQGEPRLFPEVGGAKGMGGNCKGESGVRRENLGIQGPKRRGPKWRKVSGNNETLGDYFKGGGLIEFHE